MTKKVALSNEDTELALEQTLKQFSLAEPDPSSNLMCQYPEAILHHISQGILFIDLKGILTTCNEAAEKILGFSSAELLFQPLSQFINDDFFGFPLEAALKNKQCPHFSFLTRNKAEGVKGEIEVEAMFVTEPAIEGLLILIRDITEMRHLQRLANRNSRLQELGEMAAYLAHEIRNPLGGIRGFASLLFQDLKDRPEMQKMAAHIIEGTTHLNGFVTNILHYTHPLEPRFEVLDIVHFIEDLKVLLMTDETWNPETQFIIKSNVKELFIPFDPQMMKSALINLFMNANQAMATGGILSVQIGQDTKSAIIKIKDNGIGIPNEHLDKIFSPFFTTKELGTGLGLSEVYKVIQAHQGWIEVYSEVKKGTLFIIKLPIYRNT
jgi:PAS domain S-box-containing protein